MDYWLFSIMYDHYPKTWSKMVRMGIAAEHYPPGWTNEGKNLRYLKQLERGDKIIAAFHTHRFGGYGTLTSDFYRGGPSMEIKGRNDVYEFQERADCDWTTLPVQGEGSYVHLHELKKKGFNIDLTRGLCVKKIDKASFDALRDELDRAGAISRSARERPGARERRMTGYRG